MRILTRCLLFLVIFAAVNYEGSWADINNEKVVFLTAAAQLPTQMGPEPSEPSDLKPLEVVGLSDDYPIMFINRNGLPDGLAVDLLRLFSEAAGYELHLDLVTYDQLELRFENDYDIYYSSGRVKAPESARSTTPFYIRNYKLFVDQNVMDSKKYQDLFREDSGRLSIGYRSSDTLAKYLSNMATNNALIAMPNHDAALDGLLADQFDAVLLPSDLGKFLFNERQLTQFQPLETTLFLEENSFMVSPDHILLQFELNNFLQNQKKSGNLQSIIEKWIVLPAARSEEQDVLSLFNYFFLISAAATFAFSYRSYHLERNVEKQAAELSQLNHANEELWTALIDEERYKNEYYISLSHELRTPISLILNAVNAVERSAVVKSRDLPDDKFIKYTNIAKNNSMRLLRVINNLIDANQLENKDYTLDLKRVDLVFELNELIKWVVEVLDPIEVEIQLDTQLKTLEATIDPYELDRILLNLISNSIKFNEGKTRILLELKCEDQTAVLDYADNSIGIPKASVQNAFLKYHQLTSEFAKKSEGAGFGLYLSKQLIELHRGTLSPIYAAQQDGMHYRLQFPLKLSDEHNKLSSGKSLFYDRGRLVRLELSEIKTFNK